MRLNDVQLVDASRQVVNSLDVLRRNAAIRNYIENPINRREFRKDGALYLPDFPSEIFVPKEFRIPVKAVFPTFVETIVSFSDSNVGSLSVSLGFGSSAIDDIEIVSWCNDGDSGRSIGGTGWASVHTQTGSGNNSMSSEIWWRRVDSGNVGDTSATVTISGGDESCAAHAYRITGAVTSGTAVTAGTAPSLSTTQTPDPPSVGSGGADDHLFIVTGWAKRGQTSSPVNSYPTNYTANQTATNTGGSNGMTMATCARTLNAASDDPGVLTWAFTRQTTINTLRVVPAAAGGGGIVILRRRINA